MSDRRRWTIQVFRDDGSESHTLRAGRRGLVLAIGSLAAVLIAIGVTIGRMWTGGAESATIGSLRAQLEAVGDQRRVSELAARLQHVEAEYRRLQAALTEGAPAQSPALAVPLDPPSARGPELESTSPAWPVAQRGFVTRTFGSRGSASEAGHTGIDIAVPSGSYVRATRAGVVEETGEDSVYGRYVRIAHGGGLASLYGHNSWLFAAVGDSVERLQVIALSGSTGRSTAPHVHFEIRVDGEPVDPLAFVTGGPLGATGGAAPNGVEQR